MIVRNRLDEYLLVDGVRKPTLVENSEWKPSEYNISEGKDAGSRKMTVEGVLQRADVKNANNRIYTRALWERVLNEPAVKNKLESRNMYGVADHPADGKTLISKVSHIVTELTMKPDGVIWGKVEILPTREGLDLMELFRAGCTVGISSRGGGTCESRNGIDYVNETDFVLDTWDFVVDPSTPGAEPKVKESKEPKTLKEDLMNKQRLAEYRTSLTSIREMDFTNMGKKGLSFIENQLYSIGIALAESTHAEDKAVVAEATMLLREHESIQNQVRVSGKANGSTGSIRESLDGVFGEAGQAEVTTSGKLVEGLVEKGKELKGLKESAELKLERAIKIIEGIREEYKKLEKSHLSMIEKAKSWKGKVLAKVTERLDRYKTQMSGMSENLTTANLKIKALEKLKEAQRVTESKVIHGVPPVKKPTNLSEGKGAPVPANGESPKKLSEGVAMANSLKARTGFRY